MSIEDEYSFKFGFSFQIHRLSKMIRSKSKGEESRISKFSDEKEWFFASQWLLIEDLFGLVSL